MTTLRALEEASLALEQKDAFDNPDFAYWMKLLFSPGASLGGARPKASVRDPKNALWIAKFPSVRDDRDIGGWEQVANILAVKAGIIVAEGSARRFTKDHHTYLTKRFDRSGPHRLHFASAMTLLGKTDGADAVAGVSYLDIAEFIMRHGAQPEKDLQELWKRVVFYMSISNSDDHLRNHGFLLTPKGWKLAPAYDINPAPGAHGLSLNVSETSNDIDLELAREVAEKFRIREQQREQLINTIINAVSKWHTYASEIGISKNEIQQMEPAFNIK